MALNIKTSSYFEIKESNRFDAKFFSLKQLIKNYEDDEEINLVSLGDGDLIKEITDGEHNGQEFFDNGVLFIKNSSIKDFGISLFDGFYVAEEKHKNMRRSALQAEDILFTTIGHLGSAAIVPENFEEANINQNLVRIKVNRDIVNPYYLVAFLNSVFVRQQIDYLFTGNIQSILTYPKIKAIKVIIPSKEMQDKVEENYKKAINLEKEALSIIENVQKFIRECMKLENVINEKILNFSLNRNELCSAQIWLPSHFNPKYNIMLEYIKNNFKYKRLGDKNFTKITAGDEVGSDAYINYLEKQDKDIPFIRTSDFYNYQLDLCPDNFVDSEILDDLKQDVKCGDLLFTNDGKIGEMAMVNMNSKFIAQSHIKIIKSIDPDIPTEYIFAMLSINEIGKYQVEKNTVIQSTIPTLANRLNDFIIPILEQNEIEKIVCEVKKANLKFKEKDELIRKIQQQIKKIL